MEKGYNYWYKNLDDFDDKIVLASVQRSISNFVKILTNKDIPVSYSSGGDSYTNGKSITICSNIGLKNLDSVVGLALHEASHCLLSDYKVFKIITNRCLEEKIDSYQSINIVKDLLNWVEDRRIDSFVFQNAPGYKVYYHACYDRFFQDQKVDNLLQTSNKEEDWDCYMFRIINLLNKNTDLKALNHLKGVYDILDLKNVDRLKTTQDSLDLAIKIFKFLEPHVKHPSEKENNFESNLSSNKILNKQRKFLKGHTSKVSVGVMRKNEINEISKSNFTLFKLNSKTFKGDKNVIILEDLKGGKGNGDFGLINKVTNPHNVNAVDEGIELGKILTSKLKIRNEQKTLYTNRLKKGKVDSKRLYTAEFLDDIFKKTTITELKPVKLHISVDASGSMKNGNKWEKTIKLVSALSYASLKIPNLDVVVSFRTTSGKTPLMLIAFDSTKHNIDKIHLFKSLACNGATPEGLCIEAILDKIPNTNYKNDSYFLNLSDGMPTFSPFKYANDFAVKHTKEVISRLRKKGVNILSYFITNNTELKYQTQGEKNFKEMYGKESSFINISSLNQVTTTLNKLFLK